MSGIDDPELERPQKEQKEPKCSVAGHCGIAEGCSFESQEATASS